MKPRAPKTCEVKAHARNVAPCVLFNATSFALMRETGFVLDLVKTVFPKPRERVKAGRKVQ